MRGLKRVARRFEDGLSGLDWRAFERLLAEHYRERGYRVEHCGMGGSAQRFDGDVDLRLDGHGETVLAQCKYCNALKVPLNATHELLGIVVAREATRGILVNAGEYTKPRTSRPQLHPIPRSKDAGKSGPSGRRLLSPSAGRDMIVRQ